MAKLISVKEIKHIARERVNENGGDSISLMLFLLAIFAFIGLVEASVYLLLKNVGLGYFYDFHRVFTDLPVTIMWIIQVVFICSFFMYEFGVIRRLFLEVSMGMNYVSTRQYISAHSNVYFRRTLFSSAILNFIKLVVLTPALISGYGIYYWGVICKINELTSVGLFAFMLCVGFTIVWLGFFIDYCVSLALTPYIMALNPRTNIFDACDLSQRLMDGHHSNYLGFLASFLIYIPTIILVYPFFALFPFFMVCYNIMIEQIMGKYWQDKVPGMIKRWRKYQ